MSQWRYILITGIFVLLQLRGSGSEFRYLRPYEGLMDSEINSIVQDNDGLMWFATWSGLITYDGASFKYYRPVLGDKLSIPEKKTKKLLLDSNNTLWIAMARNVCFYDPEKDNFHTLRFVRNTGAPMNVLDIVQFGDYLIIHAVDNIYYIPIKEKESLIAKSIRITDPSGTEGRFMDFITVENDVLYTMVADDETNTSQIFGIGLADIQQIDDVTLDFITGCKGIVSCMESHPQNNLLYIGTNVGVGLFNTERNVFTGSYYFQGEQINNALVTSDNRIYFSSSNPILHYIDFHTGESDEYIADPYRWGSLLNNNILSLYEDFSGNLWVGHQGLGISILNLHRKEFTTYRHYPRNPSSLSSNQIMCINGSENLLFVGCRVGGINITGKTTSADQPVRFKKVPLKENGRASTFNSGVWDIQPYSENLFLAASLDGLFTIRRENNEWYLARFSSDAVFNDYSVRKIFIDENRNIWTGISGVGLVYIPDLSRNPGKNFYVYSNQPDDQTSITDNEIISMTLDSRDRFWIGTTNGLNLLEGNYRNLDLSGNTRPDVRFRRFVAIQPDNDFLNNNEINCIFENTDGRMWIATQGGGINIYDPSTGIFSHLTVENGLPSNDVQGILMDEQGSLWISTTNDLVSYSQHEPQPTFTHYNYYDGTQGPIYMVNSYYKAIDGEMFFGGDNGLTRFYPRQIKSNPIEPKIILTELRLSQETIKVGDTINNRIKLEKTLNFTDNLKLTYRENIFSIGVAVAHFQLPIANNIVYKLEDYDESWKNIPATKKYIEYANIPFGRYVLKIRAISSDNIVSAEIRELPVEISPPWYRTWYMVLIFFVTAVAIIGVFIYVLVNRQKLIYDKKMDEIAIQSNESKMMFLTNIAHGLRTPLSLIIAPIEDLLQNYAGMDPVWKKHLVLMHKNAKYLLKLINQIIDFRKLHAGKLKLYRKNTNMVQLLNEVATNFKGIEDQKNISIHMEVPEEEIVASVDSQKIEEVLYNLISNAFKHTFRDRSIIVTMDYLQPENASIKEGMNGRMIKITVFNEGTTIPEPEKLKIFERFYKSDETIEGAGIGLSFSKSLVELHNGSIEVESIENRGVAFHVYLPVGQLEPEPVAADPEDIQTEFNEHVFYSDSEADFHIPDDQEEKDLKLVIIEDNNDLRSFLKNVLSRDYTVFEAEEGRGGLNLIRTIVPDIVISDVIMPGMDGFELCNQVKKDSSTCHIPVILLTAKNTEDQIISGYDVGADAYVTKPFNLSIISSQISRLIKNRELIRKKYMDQNFMVEVSMSSLSKDDEFMVNIRSYLTKNLSDPEYNVKMLADDLHISTTQLYRKVKALTGYSPVEFVRILKLQKAYELLSERNNSVKEVCYLSGFNNISYFIKCFREHFGVTPASLRDKGKVDIEIT